MTLPMSAGAAGSDAAMVYGACGINQIFAQRSTRIAQGCDLRPRPRVGYSRPHRRLGSPQFSGSFTRGVYCPGKKIGHQVKNSVALQHGCTTIQRCASRRRRVPEEEVRVCGCRSISPLYQEHIPVAPGGEMKRCGPRLLPRGRESRRSARRRLASPPRVAGRPEARPRAALSRCRGRRP